MAPILQEKLYQRYSGVLYTSATIAVDGNFDYFLQRTGLDAVEDTLSLLQLPPAFDYKTRSLFGVPESFPATDEPGYPAAFGDFAAALIQSLGGRIFFYSPPGSSLRSASKRPWPDCRKGGATCA